MSRVGIQPAPPRSLGQLHDADYLFPPPEFKPVRFDEYGWEPSRLALARAAGRAAGPPRPADLAEDLSAKPDPIRRG